MERFGGDISFMIMQLQFQPKIFRWSYMKFLGEMIIVALLVKILICWHNITKNSCKYWENCQKYWAKNAENIRNYQDKNTNSEKAVKNIDLKLQKILEIVKPKTVNTG